MHYEAKKLRSTEISDSSKVMDSLVGKAMINQETDGKRIVGLMGGYHKSISHWYRIN